LAQAQVAYAGHLSACWYVYVQPAIQLVGWLTGVAMHHEADAVHGNIIMGNMMMMMTVTA
jgi:hypothetical protein